MHYVWEWNQSRGQQNQDVDSVSCMFLCVCEYDHVAVSVCALIYLSGIFNESVWGSVEQRSSEETLMVSNVSCILGPVMLFASVFLFLFQQVSVDDLISCRDVSRLQDGQQESKYIKLEEAENEIATTLKILSEWPQTTQLIAHLTWTYWHALVSLLSHFWVLAFLSYW